MTPTHAPCEMKGVAFFSLLEAIRVLRGEEAEAATRAALPDALGQSLRLGAISRIGWYPMRDYEALHVAAQRACGGGEPFARALGYKATEIDTRGVLKFILSITSVGLLLRHADRVFSTYTRGSDIRTLRPASGNRHEITFSRMGGAGRYTFSELEGGTMMLLERTGAKDPVVRRESMSEADGTLVLVADWG